MIQNVSGLPPETLNNLEKLAQAIGDDPTFYNTIDALLFGKANSADVYNSSTVVTKLSAKQDALHPTAPLLWGTSSIYPQNIVLTIDSAAYASQSDTYTKEQSDANLTAAINNLIQNAPTALSNFQELANALAN